VNLKGWLHPRHIYVNLKGRLHPRCIYVNFKEGLHPLSFPYSAWINGSVICH
jgi:hypothetical protein